MPANEVCEGYVFTGVCLSTRGGGRAWLLQRGGACVVAPGMCVVAPGGHAWLLPGMCVVAPGGHAWLLGGVCGCSGGGHVWLLWGGHAWLLPGGVWLLREGMRGIRRDTEIRSMSGRYASYWNAFLLLRKVSLMLT